MVFKKDLKDYEFDCMAEYFEYILITKANGQSKQLRSLIEKLSNSQVIEFSQWLSEPHNKDEQVAVLNLIIEILCEK